MTNVTFQLTNLSCPSCIPQIENAYKNIPGVKEVKVLFNSSRVRLEYDGALVDEEKLKTIPESLGYPVVS